MSADIRTSNERPEIDTERDGLLYTIASIAAEYLLEDEQPLEPLEDEDSQPDNDNADAHRRPERHDGGDEPAREVKIDSTAGDDSQDLGNESEPEDQDQAEPSSPTPDTNSEAADGSGNSNGSAADSSNSSSGAASDSSSSSSSSY